MTHCAAFYLQTWAFVPAVILRHLRHIHSPALSPSLTFPSNYRCFSLLAVWIEAIFSWHWHMFKDKASFNYFLTFMWGLRGYAYISTFHLNIWGAAPLARRLNRTRCHATPRAVFNKCLACCRLGTANYRSTYPRSDLRSGYTSSLLACFDPSSRDVTITSTGRRSHGV